MDGFDKPLSGGKLTRNLWDQLRELALKPSLRLVTASRRTLRDLIRNPDAQTSDFWNIFEPSPVRVGCFDDGDLTAVLAQVPDLQLSGGAKTELWNASNGFPVIVLEVLNALCELGKTGEINPDAIQTACEVAFPWLRDKIDSLWADCSPSCQDLLRRVLEERALARSGIPNVDVDTLTERGFVYQVGNRLERPNRLLGKYLGEQPNEDSAMARLFGAVETYQQHFKGALERRIAQINSIDETLRRYLERVAGLLLRYELGDAATIAADAERLAKVAAAKPKTYPIAIKQVLALSAEAYTKSGNPDAAKRCRLASVEQTLAMQKQVSVRGAIANWVTGAAGVGEEALDVGVAENFCLLACHAIRVSD